MKNNNATEQSYPFYLNDTLVQDSYNRHQGRPIRILLNLYRGNYKNLFLSTFCYIIKHSPVWALPIVTANVVNYVTNQPENLSSLLIYNIVLMITLILINIPANYFHTRFRSLATRSVEAGLRSSLVRKIQQLSISFHKDMESGRLQSKIIRDVEAVETLSSQLFISLLNILINIVVALSVTIAKSKVVFIFFLLTIPVAALTIFVFKRPMKKHNHSFRKEMESTSAKVMEMVEMIPITRAHALEKKESNVMSNQLINIAAEGYRLDIIQSTFGSVSWAIFQIFQVICLLFTANLAIKKIIPVGDIVLYQSYFMTIINQVTAIITLLPTMTKGMESIRSIGEILNANDIENYRDKKKISSLKGDYIFENIHFSYAKDKKSVLNGVSMHIKEGETVAFVGESGAGKSTLLNIIIGFLMPSEGKLLVDGIDIRELNLRSYRRFLAVVPQSTVLFSGSIRDNITYGLENVTEEEVLHVVKAANLEEMIQKLPDGLDTLVGSHGDKLSGGQKQRISIARALIRNPSVILFDEATSALDSISEKLIQNALEKLTKGKTTFLVAHRLSTIRSADKIAVLKNGVCVEFGTWDELMAKKGEFYKMKSLQM